MYTERADNDPKAKYSQAERERETATVDVNQKGIDEKADNCNDLFELICNSEQEVLDDAEMVQAVQDLDDAFAR